ncbi:hypothetical protein EOD41_19460 [Mucilaginibacter limnophilus]|uniref:Uncharacterized protein n=1 Tax=Mucilaginibacter limnophilus TaxID=1932778 RepID=A0A3S2XY47_9SPHI|nr:hypothetical protein [Mucilaginibacter limnophilus]RVT97187.1 hypothetical protein EOD41_19460 [Mucilaginibacter limnophilus]
MEYKLFSPKQHGINDYLFCAVILAAPHLLHFKKKTTAFYNLLSLNLATYNALSDHPVAVKRLIPYHQHHKIDILNVAGLALLTAWKGIRKQKKSLWFHAAFVTLAAANVLLTNWRRDKYENEVLFI